jgi:hypothetical protein
MSGDHHAWRCQMSNPSTAINNAQRTSRRDQNRRAPASEVTGEAEGDGVAADIRHVIASRNRRPVN